MVSKVKQNPNLNETKYVFAGNVAQSFVRAVLLAENVVQKSSGRIEDEL